MGATAVNQFESATTEGNKGWITEYTSLFIEDPSQRLKQMLAPMTVDKINDALNDTEGYYPKRYGVDFYDH